MSSEKFCLHWNDFESNISNAFIELLGEKDFVDVTLACEDEQIQAHKVILAACSPFFRNILRRNHHQHPLLYMMGIKYCDLQAVLNFMYHGEVIVAQEELNSFLAVAEDLKVKGLTQSQSSSNQSSSKQSTHQQQSRLPSPPVTKPSPLSRPDPPPKRSYPPPATHDDDDIQEVVPIKSEPLPPVPLTSPHVPLPAQPQVDSSGHQQEDQTEATYQEVTGCEDYGDYQDPVYTDTDNTMDHTMCMQGAQDGTGTRMFQEYIYKSDQSSGWKCTICGKESAQKVNLVKHVESIHSPNCPNPTQHRPFSTPPSQPSSAVQLPTQLLPVIHTSPPLHNRINTEREKRQKRKKREKRDTTEVETNYDPSTNLTNKQSKKALDEQPR